jgi:hypothetical protein
MLAGQRNGHCSSDAQVDPGRLRVFATRYGLGRVLVAAPQQPERETLKDSKDRLYLLS